jgi:hypothetical protein
MKYLEEIDGEIKLKSKYKPWIILLCIVVVLLFQLPGLIMVIVLYIGFKQYIKHMVFMKTYANEINFDYIEEMSEINKYAQTLKARIFRVGNSKTVSHILAGKYKDFKTKIFNYSYNISSGKNTTTYRFTISEIELEKTKFPHIFLKSKNMWRHYSSNIFSKQKDVKISLEAPFNEKFTLYCTEDYEIEVLQIFTKELLDYLVKNGNKFSIEFYENKIYIYDDKTLKNKKEMDELFSIMKKIIDNSGGLLKRLHDDFDSMRHSYERN